MPPRYRRGSRAPTFEQKKATDDGDGDDGDGDDDDDDDDDDDCHHCCYWRRIQWR